MLVAALMMVFGVALVAAISQTTGLRVGGVMVVPLVAVYTFRELWTPVVFLGGAVAAFTALYAVREFTLWYGREPLLVAIATGALASIAAVLAVDRLTTTTLVFRDAEIVGSIFPGIAAYNLMRIDADRRRVDLLVAVGTYLAVVAVGVVGLVVSAVVEPGIPPVVFAEGVPAVELLGLDAPRGRFPRAVPQAVVVSLVLADLVVYEGVRRRYDISLAGVVLVPLLAVFSARLGVAFFLYALFATATFLVTTGAYWSMLLYGRNLLAVALVVGTGLAVGVALSNPDIPGLLLLFVGLFAGVGSYNLHRTAPPVRSASVSLSAGLFVVMYGALLAVVSPDPSGLASPLRWYHVAIGAVVLGVAARDLYRLERERADEDPIEKASVFSEVSG